MRRAAAGGNVSVVVLVFPHMTAKSTVLRVGARILRVTMTDLFKAPVCRGLGAEGREKVENEVMLMYIGNY